MKSESSFCEECEESHGKQLKCEKEFKSPSEQELMEPKGRKNTIIHNISSVELQGPTNEHVHIEKKGIQGQVTSKETSLRHILLSGTH